NVVNFGPVTGAPHIRDLEGGRRYGDLEGFRNILRLTHKLGMLHWQGGIVVEPVDIPVAVRHLRTYQAHIECADIVWAARGIGGVQAQDAIAMAAIEHGCTVEELAARPTLMTVTNVNSPRRVDEEILDNIMVMARHGQCVVITPFTLMGAMAPVTLAGALAQQTAEALGVVTLCQMLRPGTPCVIGGFTSNVDMRTGSPAFGTPEYCNAVLAIKDVAVGGHFLGSAHTLARYESAFYRPLLSDWSNFENWTDAGARNASERATGIWKKMLAEYLPPPLDPAVKEAIDAYVARRTRELGDTAPA